MFSETPICRPVEASDQVAACESLVRWTQGLRANTAPNTQQSGTGELQPSRIRDLRSEIPARDYAVLVALFNGALAAALLASKRRREPLPDRVDPKVLILFALATQKC